MSCAPALSGCGTGWVWGLLIGLALALPTTAEAAVGAAFTSADGSRVFFTTNEQLVAGDTDAARDVYERSGGSTMLISTGPAGGNAENNASFARASVDGSRVFFTTEEQLVAADSDSATDVYERVGGTTTLVSTGPVGGNGNIDAVFGGTSADGSRVFFATWEPLIEEDFDSDYDVYERAGGTTALISTSPQQGTRSHDAFFRAASTDGSRVFFSTDEALLEADTFDGEKHDVYVRAGGTTTLVSTGPIGGAAPVPADFAGASADGSRVLFKTAERLVAGDADNSDDLYERSGETTTLVSTGPDGGNGAYGVTFRRASADGTRVFFQTSESLVAADSDSGSDDVYERSGGTTTLISTGPDGPPGGDSRFHASFAGASADGSQVFFVTEEQLVASDTDSQDDIYRRQWIRVRGPGGVSLLVPETTLVSVGPEGGNGGSDSSFLSASADGSRVVFSTFEPLVAGDLDVQMDVYERSGGTTTLVSTGPVGGNGATAPFWRGTSPDGSQVFFSTQEPLVSEDADEREDLYLRSAGETTLVSTLGPPPETTIDSAPQPSGSIATATFTFSSDQQPGTVFECTLDGSAFGPCSGSAEHSATLEPGSHTFAVRAVNRLGQPDPTPAEATFTIEAPASADVAQKCFGSSATLTGTPGRDVLRGTSGRDVIAGLGGADRIVGLGGNDLICGGAGNDSLGGLGGRDKLDGGRGRRDLCVGGPGSDSRAAPGCESKRTIP